MKSLRHAMLVTMMMFMVTIGFGQIKIGEGLTVNDTSVLSGGDAVETWVMANGRWQKQSPIDKDDFKHLGLTPLGKLFVDDDLAIWEIQSDRTFRMLTAGPPMMPSINPVGFVRNSNKIILEKTTDGRYYTIEDKSGGSVLLSMPPKINIDTVWYEVREVGRTSGYKTLK